jgi:hypothetical protein
MTCSHASGLKCIECAPELWNPGPEYARSVNLRIIREIVENLLKWKRSYYRPDDPDVDDKDKVPDSKYDTYEDSLRKQFPNHPFLSMVGWDASMVEECLKWHEDKI